MRDSLKMSPPSARYSEANVCRRSCSHSESGRSALSTAALNKIPYSISSIPWCHEEHRVELAQLGLLLAVDGTGERVQRARVRPDLHAVHDAVPRHRVV